MSKTREHSLDVIRAFAIVTVVCEHVSPELLSGTAGLIVNVIGTMGVPLFVMLTGYLMLDRMYDANYLRRFVRHNLLPLIGALEIWNLVWFGLSHVVGGAPITFERFLKIALFMGPTDSGMWFLPMIIGLYLGLPIVSHMVQWLNEYNAREYTGILLGGIIFFGTLVPTLGELLSFVSPQHVVSSQLNLNIFGASVWGDSVWILFLIAGYAVKKKVFQMVPTWCLTVIAGVSIFLLALFHYFAQVRGLAWDTYYANIFLVIASVAFFVVGQRVFVFDDTSSAFGLITTSISKYSFAIYMIHFWVLEAYVMMIRVMGLRQNIGIFIAALLICLVGSYLVARILSFIGPLRHWMLLIK